MSACNASRDRRPEATETARILGGAVERRRRNRRDVARAPRIEVELALGEPAASWLLTSKTISPPVWA